MLTLLHHKNEDVRLKAIETLTHFEVTEAKYILKSKFADLTLAEKISFFDLLIKVASIEDSTFIINYTTHENFEIKHKALSILKTVDKNLYDKLEKESEDEDYNKIINFLDYSYGI